MRVQIIPELKEDETIRSYEFNVNGKRLGSVYTYEDFFEVLNEDQPDNLQGHLSIRARKRVEREQVADFIIKGWYITYESDTYTIMEKNYV